MPNHSATSPGVQAPQTLDAASILIKGRYHGVSRDPRRPQARTVTVKRNIHFEFSQELVRQPLLFQLNRQFDVVINIRGASVTEQGGFIALELEGEQQEIDKIVRYLRERGIEVVEGLGEGVGGA